ncbi:hypothetical protein BVER_03719c [Candidatus Burkholderia verschuerenii]|uniref:Uncharacterized protein n=1 Tax=Candidatus Burkholderia verschuerenii TaxID=242163 RepID=A0A0L0MDV7_9BURK|nr:hypothetical protein BVER_03719c [Candidatus Burkholderia verschuerenii]
MGVEVEHDVELFRLTDHTSEHAALADAMRNAGFTRASDDTASEMWTDPFALFTTLFPVLGYLPKQRYIEPVNPSSADALIETIRQRAGGRRCIGIFWSSCESPNNFAGRSLALPHLYPLFDGHDDIHWVVMQRGFERNRWLNDPRAASTHRFTTLQPDAATTRAIVDFDAFAHGHQQIRRGTDWAFHVGSFLIAFNAITVSKGTATKNGSFWGNRFGKTEPFLCRV